MTQFFGTVARSNWFNRTITVAILAAGVNVGVQTYEVHNSGVQAYSWLISLVDQIILLLFIVEVIVKLAAEGSRPWLYFKDPWNIFDFTIVTVCLLPFNAKYAAVLRLLRLLRLLKLVRALPRLQILVTALLKSIPSMGYVAILLFLVFYVYACAAVFIFGANDPVHFGHLPLAMLSLFRVVTGEDWTDVMYIAMYGCDNYGYQGMTELCTAPQAAPVFGALFFCSFMMFGAMIVLNLFIGVIMNGMDHAEAEIANEEAEEAEICGGPTREQRLEQLAKQLAGIQKEIHQIALIEDDKHDQN
jgi:voltage-gated sodium channel